VRAPTRCLAVKLHKLFSHRHCGGEGGAQYRARVLVPAAPQPDTSHPLAPTHLVHLAGHHSGEGLHLLLGHVLGLTQPHDDLLGGQVRRQLRGSSHSTQGAARAARSPEWMMARRHGWDGPRGSRSHEGPPWACAYVHTHKYVSLAVTMGWGGGEGGGGEDLPALPPPATPPWRPAPRCAAVPGTHMRPPGR
jgi:hypothetical protein